MPPPTDPTQWGSDCTAAVMTAFGYLWNELVPTSTAKPDALAVACGWQ